MFGGANVQPDGGNVINSVSVFMIDNSAPGLRTTVARFGDQSISLAALSVLKESQKDRASLQLHQTLFFEALGWFGGALGSR